MAPAALVHSICGLYRLPQNGSAPVFANHGFAREFANRLLESGGASGPVRMGRVDVLLQQPTAFASMADVIAAETPNLEIRFHTEVIGAAPDLSTIEACCRGQREHVEAQAVVDATGDGSVAAFSGAACEIEESCRLQRPAFIFVLSGVEPSATTEDARVRVAARIAAAVTAGAMGGAALGAHLRASGRTGEVFVTVDLAGGTRFDPIDPRCLSELEMEGRRVANALWRFFRESVDGFSSSYISAFPSRVGIRESRRIAGRYRLEAADLEQSIQFPDAIAQAAWPIELRETATGPRLRYPETSEPAGIPLRSLRARDRDRLFMAGRCLSASHEAQASTRVIGTCLATGEAAGLAAALAVSTGGCDAESVNAARERLPR
jgi:hypothetical protein